MFIKFGDKTPVINVKSGKSNSLDRESKENALYLGDNDRRADVINNASKDTPVDPEKEEDDE